MQRKCGYDPELTGDLGGDDDGYDGYGGYGGYGYGSGSDGWEQELAMQGVMPWDEDNDCVNDYDDYYGY